MTTRTTRRTTGQTYSQAKLPGRGASSPKSTRSTRRIPSIRPELVARARARLAAGFYDLPECFDHAMDRLVERERLAA